MLKSYSLTECVSCDATDQIWPGAHRFDVSPLHKIRHTTVGRTPLDEWSASRRDLYLTTHNKRNRRTSRPSVGIEPIIPASERQYTHALDLATTELGPDPYSYQKYLSFKNRNLNIHFSTSILSPKFADSGVTFVFREFCTFWACLSLKVNSLINNANFWSVLIL